MCEAGGRPRFSEAVDAKKGKHRATRRQSTPAITTSDGVQSRPLEVSIEEGQHFLISFASHRSVR